MEKAIRKVLFKNLKTLKYSKLLRPQKIHFGRAGISGFRCFTSVGACRPADYAGSKSVIQKVKKTLPNIQNYFVDLMRSTLDMAG